MQHFLKTKQMVLQNIKIVKINQYLKVNIKITNQKDMEYTKIKMKHSTKEYG